MSERLKPGDHLLHYKILEELGAGGMGVVYAAEDTRLGRKVAIKVLPPELSGNEQRRMRFEREARAVAALNHPNIVTLHSVEHIPPDTWFLTMELVDGRPLPEAIGLNGLEFDHFLTLALPMAEALGRAHRAGIVHRDIKTANVVLNSDGAPKILDFGLARVAGEAEIETGEDDATVTELHTRAGTVLGTPAYMAPEQARGHNADARSDVFSLGNVFYEMLTGKRPFQRDSHELSIRALLHDEPESVTSSSRKVPREFESILRKCLAKDPAERFADGDELHTALARLHRPLTTAAAAWKRPAVWLPLLFIVAVAVAWGVRTSMRASEVSKVRNEWIPQIEAMLAERGVSAGFEPMKLALQAQRVLPDDPTVDKLVRASSFPVSLTSTPEGADIYIRAYRDDGAETFLCSTPCETRAPFGFLVMRYELEGYEPLSLGRAPGRPGSVELQPVGQSPEGMLRVDGGSGGNPGGESFDFPPFWVDRHEVTNARFQEFVNAGGYSNPDYWPSVFEGEAGTKLTLAQASTRFVDATGRPGPAGWQLSQYPEGQPDHPVTGVSWYEAAAYAKWRGRDLPTFHHWLHYSGRGYFAEILLESNFDSEGTLPVDPGRGLGPYGTSDTAGNVREWTSTRVIDHFYAMGGSYDDLPYAFSDDNASEPWDRLPTIGFRTVQYDTLPPAAALQPFDAERFDFNTIEPMSDELYALVRERYVYPPMELDAKLESEETSEHWRRETISFESAYGGERVLAHVFLPTNAQPPYETVLYRPGSTVNSLESIADFAVFMPIFLSRSGRAVVVPALYGTLERRVQDRQASEIQDRLLRQVQDTMRTVEYLKTRDDVDPERLAYVGLSAGGEYGPCYVANIPEFKAAVFLAGGYHDAHMLEEPRDQVPWHFAPRVTVPTLMVNADNDFSLPIELAQKPMFEALGTPEGQKRHVIVEGGHIPFDQTAVIRETLDWLERWVGE